MNWEGLPRSNWAKRSDVSRANRDCLILRLFLQERNPIFGSGGRYSVRIEFWVCSFFNFRIVCFINLRQKDKYARDNDPL